MTAPCSPLRMAAGRSSTPAASHRGFHLTLDDYCLKVLVEGDPVERDRLAGPVGAVRLDGGDRVDDVHALGDVAEDRVLAVEPGGGLGGDDEELAPVRVRAPVRHRERAAHDRPAVLLVLELVPGAAG